MLLSDESNNIVKGTDYKYLLAYIIPVSGFFSVYLYDKFSFLTVFIAFGLLPILEETMSLKPENEDQATREAKSDLKIFDFLLYINMPMVFALVLYSLYTVTAYDLTSLQWTGVLLSCGIVLGTAGINVAHEIGHRKSSFDQWFARFLLMPSLYMHFHIEHNLGHHKNVATPEDTATAIRGEWVYYFWFKSMIGGVINSIAIESRIVRKKHGTAFHLSHRIIQFVGIQFLYLFIVHLYFGMSGLLFAVFVALVSVLLLESINYVEHYGLLRKKNASGKYERVSNRHSWNSNHVMGRIFLYELTRHSDHHFKSTIKYQSLKHYDESPQLPHGYPASILIALVPPLWFYVAHKRLDELGLAA